MKIAIISDAHDHKGFMSQALDQIQSLQAEALLMCGDIGTASMYKLAATRFQKPIHAIFGNNDNLSFKMIELFRDNQHLIHHDQYANIRMDDKRIGLTHYPFYAKYMAMSGEFDVVCFGHNHKKSIDPYGKCLAINPGALLGEGTEPSFAVYDTKTHTAQLFSL